MNKRLFIIITVNFVVHNSFAQQSFTAFSHWSTYFKQENTYSFPITPKAMPGMFYEYHSNKQGKIGFNLGMALNLQPVFSTYRFSISDTNFNVPTEWQYKERHAGYIARPAAISLGANCGLYFRNQNSPHQFNLGLTFFTTLNPNQVDGASLMGRPPSGQGPALPFAIFLQRYDFNPNSLFAIRLQTSYRYHFMVFKQPFFAITRLEYQVNNLPEVQFEVYNTQELLISSFEQHYPRLYGSFGLGWCWGTKK
jgi:hypothetical protein